MYDCLAVFHTALVQYGRDLFTGENEKQGKQSASKRWMKQEEQQEEVTKDKQKLWDLSFVSDNGRLVIRILIYLLVLSENCEVDLSARLKKYYIIIIRIEITIWFSTFLDVIFFYII
jgi:hypothetical protein